MIKTTQAFSTPKDDNLIIPGELLKIEINFNSFCVHYQLPCNDHHVSASYLVFQRYYPLAYLKAFFRINGEENGNIFCHRPAECTLWSMIK